MITLQEFRFYVSVYKIVKLLVIDKYTHNSCSCLWEGGEGVYVRGVCVCVLVTVAVLCARAALRPKLSIPII